MKYFFLILSFSLVVCSGYCQRRKLGLDDNAKAPDFELKDSTGNSIRLSDFKGHYVLLEFWASWCLPCRWENPNVVEAYKKFKDKGLVVIGVSLDSIRKDWTNAIREDKLYWYHVTDLKGWNSVPAKMYNAIALPYNFLIDPNGVVIDQLLKKEKLHKKLEEVFSK